MTKSERQSERKTERGRGRGVSVEEKEARHPSKTVFFASKYVKRNDVTN